MTYNFIIANLLTFLLISFSLGLILIPFVRKLAFLFKIIDAPDGKLKLHEKPIPYLGGLAVYISSLLIILLKFNYDFDIFILLTSLSFLMILGLIDDIYTLKPIAKFFGQLLSVVVLLFSCFYNKQFFINSFFTIFLKIFWNLSLINAFNLIDVMDGLCSLSSIISISGFMTIALIFDQYNLACLLFIFLGAIGSFFVYNFPPASIYLGDAGSMLLGGLLGSIPLLINWPSVEIGIVGSVSILAIPILELTSLILVRLYKKIPVYLGSPDHFSIYLKQKGWTKKQILAYVAFVGMTTNIIVFLSVLKYIEFHTLIILLTSVCCAWCVILIF